MDVWKKLSSTEKMMIGFLILMLLLVILNWNKVSQGLEEGIKPYQEKSNIEINE